MLEREKCVGLDFHAESSVNQSPIREMKWTTTKLETGTGKKTKFNFQFFFVVVVVVRLLSDPVPSADS